MTGRRPSGESALNFLFPLFPLTFTPHRLMLAYRHLFHAGNFAGVAAGAVERAVKELQEMRRQASSQIVIPEGIPPGLAGGGKIKMP